MLRTAAKGLEASEKWMGKGVEGAASALGRTLGRGGEVSGNAVLSPKEVHVLLVDDDRVSRLVVANLLRKCQYKVTVAESGAEAISVLSHYAAEFNILLSDVMMPDIGGIEVLRHVRSNSKFDHVAVVMMSHNEDSTTVFECVQNGAQDYLLKPVTKKDMQHIWQHVWRKSQEGEAPGSGSPRKDDVNDGWKQEVEVGEGSGARDIIPSAKSGGVDVVVDDGLRKKNVFQGCPVTSRGGDIPRRWLPMRGWMQRKQRSTDRGENLFVFHRTLQLVVKSHLANGELVKLRPSRLIISDDLDVTFIGGGEANDGRGGGLQGGIAQQNTNKDAKSWTEDDEFYQSPEEMGDSAPGPASDVYSAGVLLFELLSNCCDDAKSMSAKSKSMSDLRKCVLPRRMLLEQAQDCALLLLMLHPDPEMRPSMSDVLCSNIVLDGVDSYMTRVRDRAVVMDEVDSDLLLRFLRSMRSDTSERLATVEKQLKVIGQDIVQIETNYGSSRRNQKLVARHMQSGEKRKRLDMLTHMKGGGEGDNPPIVDTVVDKRMEAMKARIADSHEFLENSYFKKTESWGDLKKDATPELDRYAQDLYKFGRYSRFDVLATISSPNISNSASMICSLCFDRDSEYIASAGVDRKVKMYDYKAVLKCDVDFHYPIMELEDDAKLSSCNWSRYIKSLMLTSNYEGAVKMWDTSTGQMTTELSEHTSRVWSLDFAVQDPTRFASGSDDGVVKVWTLNQPRSLLSIQANANVCCVAFNPSSPFLLAFGCADYKAYYYDIRNPTRPCAIFGNHTKAVSYARFLNEREFVTASTDNSLRLWDTQKAVASNQTTYVNSECSYSGHINEKNFIGLTVDDDYIYCGSEDGHVVGYFKGCSKPILKHRIDAGQRRATNSGLQNFNTFSQDFVSCVHLSRETGVLLAASSGGLVKVLKPV